MSAQDAAVTPRTDVSGAESESASAPGLPSTADMLDDLDRVQETIPRLLDSLASALGALLERDTELARQDKWEEHLAGFSGQFYGRLNEVQLVLRSTLRTLRTLQRSPYALQPPNPAALRASFAPSAPAASTLAAAGPAGHSAHAEEDDDDLLDAPELAARDAARIARAEEDAAQLSLYAVRLELRAMRELRDGLRGLRAGRWAGPAPWPKGDERGAERGQLQEEMLPEGVPGMGAKQEEGGASAGARLNGEPRAPAMTASDSSHGEIEGGSTTPSPSLAGASPPADHPDVAPSSSPSDADMEAVA